MGTLDPKALLQRLLRETAEREWLEFKDSNANPEMIGRCISACANAAILAGRDRAFIVWGIEDGTKKKVGTKIRLSELKKGNENLDNWLARMIEPRIVLEYLDFDERGKTFSIITIDHCYSKPVQFSGAAYIRIGQNVKPLKDFAEHERAIWLATGRHKFESATALPHQSEDDVLNAIDFESYYKLAQEAVPANKSEIIRRLLMLDFVREDWEGGYDITNLGAILFAKDIRQFPSISNKSVRVIKYKGKDKRKSEDEQEGQKGYAVGFQGLVKYIMASLPKEEKYINGKRTLESVYSDIAIREITANALIHQDFTVSGVGPVVEIYDDRVEVFNPGNSLIERDRMIDERKSRNEKLAKAMRDLGFCEERGGGLDKAIIDIEEKFLPAPLFLASEHGVRFVIFGPKQFKELSKADKVWSCFCHCVVRWIRHDYMSNTTLRDRFSLAQEDYQAVSAVISDARKEGRIIPADENQGKKNAKYVPYWAA